MSNFVERLFRSRNTVKARQLESNETIITHRGPVDGVSGQYVLAHDNGDVHVINPEEFESSWEEQGEVGTDSEATNNSTTPAVDSTPPDPENANVPDAETPAPAVQEAAANVEESPTPVTDNSAEHPAE